MVCAGVLCDHVLERQVASDSSRAFRGGYSGVDLVFGLLEFVLRICGLFMLRTESCCNDNYAENHEFGDGDCGEHFYKEGSFYRG